MSEEIFIEIRLDNEITVFEQSTPSKSTRRVMSLMNVYIYNDNDEDNQLTFDSLSDK